MGTVVERGYLEDDYLEGPYLGGSADAFEGFQVELNIQAPQTGFEVELQIINQLEATGFEITTAAGKYTSCGGYLEGGYLEADYLQTALCVFVGFEVDLQIATFTGFQVAPTPYNNTNTRILCDFPSRGTTGNNITASSTEPGDFSALNMNNDLEEFFWRSVTGIITGIDLVFDTEIIQGIIVDTVAIRETNLTSSAIVVLQGSNDATFGTVTFEETLTREDSGNYYFIAPLLPTDQLRYWRFRINDSTNTEGFIRIATILFGQSRIFFEDCVTDQIPVKPRHFSDRIATEGFTNVNNDRAVRTAISLNFRNLEFSKGNFTTLQQIFNLARTNLKCLWIPDPRPQFIDRFTVFAKMREIPGQLHNNKGVDRDLINLTVELDESL